MLITTDAAAAAAAVDWWWWCCTPIFLPLTRTTNLGPFPPSTTTITTTNTTVLSPDWGAALWLHLILISANELHNERRPRPALNAWVLCINGFQTATATVSAGNFVYKKCSLCALNKTANNTHWLMANWRRHRLKAHSKRNGSMGSSQHWDLVLTASFRSADITHDIYVMPCQSVSQSVYQSVSQSIAQIMHTKLTHLIFSWSPINIEAH